MNAKITENICEVENNVILNAGEYNIHEFHFNFSEEYLDEYVKKALFIDKDGTPYEMVIANNKCDIPNELLDEPGEYLFGVYAYEVNGNELLLRYSPEPTHFYVNKGSYKPNAHTPTEPTPDEFAQYYQAMQELIANAKIELIGYIDENLPTVDIGGTSTLEPGSEATVINVGTDRNPVFVFGIPKGDPGTTDYNELENKPDLSVYALIRESANKIALDIDNETFKMKAKIFDKNNNLISESNIIDLPLESVVVSGEYDSQTQKLILTLENGNTIEVPLSGLVSGLVSEEELTNRLNTAIKIETISKNGTRLPIYNKNVDITVPSSTNDLVNNSGFITKEVTNLTHYYDKVASDTRYPLVGEAGNSLTMGLDTTTYVLTATLKDRNGRTISTQNVEFPINSILSDINDLDLNKADASDLNDEIIARQNADTGLQNQIDAITSASDVVDVVSTYSDLNNYDTTKLTDKDVIKVMQDENHSNAISYYRWNELSEAFTYIGSEGPFYTKSETDTLLNGKVDNSTLDDYVKNTDYATNNTAGVIRANQSQYGTNVSSITGTLYGENIPYSAYQNKLDGYFISKGTLENVITGKNLETANNKIITIDENSTDTQYPSAKCVYNSQKIQNDEIDGLKTLYNILPTDTDTGETISMDNTGEAIFKRIDLKGNTSQVVIPEEQGTSVSNTSIYVSDVNTDKENTIEMSGNTYQETTTGKNLFNKTDYSTIGTATNGSPTNVTKTSNSISFTSSSSNNYSGLYITNDNVQAYIDNYNSDTDYYISVDVTVNKVCKFGSLQTTTDYVDLPIGTTRYSVYGKITSTINFYVRNAIDGGVNVKLENIMISTSSETPYEPYTYGASPNPSYPQNIEVVTGENDITICGKNLFDKSLFETFTTSIKYIEMTLKPNTTYTMSSNIPTQSNNTDNANLFFMLDGQSASSSTNGIKPNQPRTQTTDATGKVKIGYRDFQNEYTDEANTYWYMLEQGSTATTYEPYVSQTYPINLGNIELCKISTYKDRIYKSNDKWYLEKNIGKVVLNGSENGWTKYKYTFYINDLFVGKPTSICSNFNNAGYSWISDNEELRGKYSTNNVENQFKCMPMEDMIVANFKTWLSTNNIILYYTLTTPTTTEITDTTLVNQLNALYNATIYPITNINTDTSNLLPYIDLHYNFVTPSPSPNRPSTVNVVKGNNTITIEGKNLFKAPTTPSTSDKAIYTKINNNSISLGYTQSSSSNSSAYARIDFDISRLKPNTKYTLSKSQSVNGTSFTGIGSLRTRLNGVNGNVVNANSITFTTPSVLENVGIYFYLAYQNTTTGTATITFDNIQLEEGETASTYEPYVSQTYPINLGNIELCKIGTYQDYIYESNGNWFKKGNIGEVVLNGSESWTYFSVAQGSLFRNNNVIQDEIKNNTYVPYSKYYQGISYNDYQNRQNNQFYINSNNNFLDFIDNRYTNANDFKNWLSTHNTIVYYVLATPTDTQITDTTLITQLNNIKKACSYDTQTNISQTNTDKPFIITAEMFLSLKNILNQGSGE